MYSTPSPASVPCKQRSLLPPASWPQARLRPAGCIAGTGYHLAGNCLHQGLNPGLLQGTETGQ